MIFLIVYFFVLFEKYRFLFFCKFFDVSKLLLDIFNKLIKFVVELVFVFFIKICN